MRLGLGHGLDVGYRPELFSDVPLLDTYSGAAAAYSLRKLRSGVTSVVRVRRSSDNAEADFTAAEVSDGTLTTWTGASDGFVVTWYDQSGNSGRDATQAVAADQPKIVNAGSLITENGKPAISFDGVSDFLAASVSTTGFPFTVFTKGKYTDPKDDNYVTFGPVNARYIKVNNNGNWWYANGVSDFSTVGYTSGQNFIMAVIFNSTSSIVSYNGSLYTGLNTGADSSTYTTMRIGARADSTQHGTITPSEIIIYDLDKSSDRAAIESAINSHYSIY